MRKTLAGCHALLGEDARPSNGPVDVVIDGHYIQEVRPSGVAPPEGEKIDLAGRLLTAGLINGHHHSHEGYYKGRKDNLPLELWMNYVRPLKPIELTPREVYLRTMIGAIEAVHSGTTQLSVLISGGFSGAYEQLLPEFERTSGIKVTTGSGASQGADRKRLPRSWPAACLPT